MSHTLEMPSSLWKIIDARLQKLAFGLKLNIGSVRLP